MSHDVANEKPDARKKPDRNVTAPALSFALCNTADGTDKHTISLWVLDVNQFADLAPGRRSFFFSAGKTASLIYESKHHMYEASEVSLNNPGTWTWIRKWMQRGFVSAGYMKPEDATEWKDGTAAGLITDAEALTAQANRIRDLVSENVRLQKLLASCCFAFESMQGAMPQLREQIRATVPDWRNLL